MGSLKKYVFGRVKGGVLDADAQAFITAALITNTTQKNAIDNLVKALKSNNIWIKAKAIHPFIGGTAFSHKWNLKDPRDIDAAFRLLFFGGVIHSQNGLKGNTNGYANTFLNPNSVLSANNIQLAVYNRSNIIEVSNIIGVSNGSSTSFLPIISISPKFDSNGQAGFRAFDYSAHELIRGLPTPLGFIAGSVLNSTSQSLYMNGTKRGVTITSPQTQGYPNFPIFYLARNDANSPANFATNEIAFGFIGDGLTDAENGILYSIINTYQIALGRQV
jgi:hypothetical protein